MVRYCGKNRKREWIEWGHSGERVGDSKERVGRESGESQGKVGT